MKKFLLLALLVFCLPLARTAFAYESSVDIKYFAKETAKITENIVLLPFRIVRDIFDPPPPRFPVFLPPPYYYAPSPGGYVIVSPPAGATVAPPPPGAQR